MHRTRTITTVTALGLALAVPGLASAQTDLRSPDTRDVITVPQTRVVEVPESGFEWGDAAIGGAATLAMVLTAGGLGLTVRARRSAATH